MGIGAHQEIRFWGKIGFLKPCVQTYPRNPIFLDLTRISFEMEWSGNFRFRVLVAKAATNVG
jgi:hypothetical protein